MEFKLWLADRIRSCQEQAKLELHTTSYRKSRYNLGNGYAGDIGDGDGIGVALGY